VRNNDKTKCNVAEGSVIVMVIVDISEDDLANWASTSTEYSSMRMIMSKALGKLSALETDQNHIPWIGSIKYNIYGDNKSTQMIVSVNSPDKTTEWL
jgi:hypothetical protein